jgi:hypothetical protein
MAITAKAQRSEQTISFSRVLRKFLVGLLVHLATDRDSVSLALLQPLTVTRVMKALNLAMKSPGDKPTRNYFKIAPV